MLQPYIESFEIVLDWKLSLTRPHVLSLISLAHRTTKLLFTLAQEQNWHAFALAMQHGFFPALSGLKYQASLVCGLAS